MSEGQWILCSERMPEDGQMALVTCVAEGCTPWIRLGTWSAEGDWVDWLDDMGMFFADLLAPDGQAIAWMPLPGVKPYDLLGGET